MEPGDLIRGRVVACEWGDDSTLLTYRVPGVHEVSFHEVVLMVLGDCVCPYHKDSPTWDDCTEGYTGPCVVKAARAVNKMIHDEMLEAPK